MCRIIKVIWTKQGLTANALLASLLASDDLVPIYATALAAVAAGLIVVGASELAPVVALIWQAAFVFSGLLAAVGARRVHLLWAREMAAERGRVEAEHALQLSEERANQLQRLVHAEHRAVLGDLTSSLWRDLINLTCAARSNLEMVRPDLAATEAEPVADAIEALDRIERRLAEIATAMRSHDRRDDHCFAADAVDDAIQLTRSRWSVAGVVEVHSEDGLGRVIIHRERLMQVVVNLILNAVEAHSAAGGGELLHARVRVRGDGGAVWVSVEDNGPGIPDRMLIRLFDPFVSSKGGGTGLGLSICRSVVEAAGGSIDAGRSTLGGALIALRLPLWVGDDGDESAEARPDQLSDHAAD